MYSVPNKHMIEIVRRSPIEEAWQTSSFAFNPFQNPG